MLSITTAVLLSIVIPAQSDSGQVQARQDEIRSMHARLNLDVHASFLSDPQLSTGAKARQLRDLIMFSRIWEQTVAAQRASPVLQMPTARLEDLQAGLSRSGVSQGSARRISSAWIDLAALLRLGQIDNDVLVRLRLPIGRLLQDFGRHEIPPFPEPTGLDNDCLLGKPEIESLTKLIAETLPSHDRGPELAGILGNARETVRWAEYAFRHERPVSAQRDVPLPCAKPACFNAWIDEVFAQPTSPGPLGTATTPVTVHGITPSRACAGETVTIHVNHTQDNAFPIEFRGLNNDLLFLVGREDCSVAFNALEQMWQVSFELPLDVPPGEFVVGTGHASGSPVRVTCGTFGPLRLPGPRIPWSGGLPSISHVTLRPDSDESTNQQVVVLPTYLQVHSSWPYSITVELRGAPTAVTVVDDSTGDVLLHRLIEPGELDAATGTTSVALTRADLASGEDALFNRRCIVRATNNCLDNEWIDIGHFRVSETSNPFQTFQPVLEWGPPSGYARHALTTDSVSHALTDETVWIEGDLLEPAELLDITSRRVQFRDEEGQWAETNMVLSLGSGVRLPVGTTAIRAVVEYGNGLSYVTEPFLVTCRPAPFVLMCLSGGGSWALDMVVPGNGTPTDPGAAWSDSGCTQLIPETSGGICVRPCDPCVNFMEHLAIRLIDSELADRARGLHDSGNDYCELAGNQSESRGHQVIVGRWNNSEDEPTAPADRTFEDVVSEFVEAGATHLILVGQSHGGSKLAHLVTDGWAWGDALDVPLFVCWDMTGTEGPVTSVGSLPDHIVNFYQTETFGGLPQQNGAAIEGAHEQHLLDGCLDHNQMPHAEFVHDRTREVIAESLRQLRQRARLAN